MSVTPEVAKSSAFDVDVRAPSFAIWSAELHPDGGSPMAPDERPGRKILNSFEDNGFR
jgi:hypothetical protein